jgi:hypothetical protein
MSVDNSQLTGIEEFLARRITTDPIGSLSVNEVRDRIRKWEQSASIGARFRVYSGGIRGGLKTFGYGMASSFLPLPAMMPGSLAAASAGTVGKATGASSLLQGIGGRALGAGFAVLGPGITAWRLGKEVPQERGILAQTEKTARIIGEEAIYGGMGYLGGVLGMAAAGAIFGTAGGLPGVIAGMAIGAAIGITGGRAGASAFNRAMDIGLAPAKAAHSTLKYFSALGKQVGRMQLGGQMSVANASAAGATMRQRALMEINNSVMNQRSLLGREAALMHMP